MQEKSPATAAHETEASHDGLMPLVHFAIGSAVFFLVGVYLSLAQGLAM